MSAVAPVTDNHAELRQALSSLIDSGTSIADLADLAGTSRSSISRFLNEPGWGSPQLIAKIERLVERLHNRSAAATTVKVSEDGFVWTADANEVFWVCELSMQNRRLGVIVAPPGTGKTFALERFVRNKPDSVVFVRANPNMSSAGLCIRIGQQLGLNLVNGQSLDYMVDSIVARLREDPKLVIIDEADYLTSKASLRRMELLRTIYDESGCGMVLCGMPRLMTALTSGLSMKDNLAQFYSRVAYLRKLQGWSDDEIRAFARNYELEADAWALIYKLARDQERGGMRRIGNLLANAAYLADGERITLNHLRTAAQELELMRG